MIVGVMQKDSRKKRKEGKELFAVGYVLYKLTGNEPDEPLSMKYFETTRTFDKSPTYLQAREVICRHKLPPGNYLIVPSTFDPHQEAEFLLRLYSEKPQKAEYAYALPLIQKFFLKYSLPPK